MSTLGVFNLGTKTNANAEGVKEGVHYKIVKDGNGLEHRILNFENPELCPREGIIELEPLRTSKRHLNRVSFRTINDKEFGVKVGIPLGIDQKTKELIFERIYLEERETFDLSDPKQAMKWACIKRSHFYSEMVDGKQMNPNFQTGTKSAYKAYDKEREAIVFELNRRTKRNAVDIAEALVGADLEDMALNLGYDPKTLSPKALWMEVVKFAENSADKFMAIWNSDARAEMSILKRGISMGVISVTLDKGYAYNGLTLGYNEPEAVKYLKDHKATAISIDTVSRRNETDGQKSMNVAPKIMDEKDAVIAKLQAELAKVKSHASEATEKALDLQTEVDLRDNDPELASLIVEAKRLGIKGVHNMKDKDKIRAKMAEVQKMIKN